MVGTLRVTVWYMGQRVVATLEIVGVGTYNINPADIFVMQLAPATYVLKCTSPSAENITCTRNVTIVEGLTEDIIFEMEECVTLPSKKFPWNIVIAGVVTLSLVYLISKE